MTNLKVIKCTSISERYLNAFWRVIDNNGENIFDAETGTTKKLVFYGVKYIATQRKIERQQLIQEETESCFKMIELIQMLMMRLTPNDFVNLFPIKKEYLREDFGWKDYFYTVDKLKAYPADQPIGNNLDDLLWDYTNDTICRFMVNMLCTASQLRRFQGQMGIAEEWAEKQGIPTYSVNENEGYVMNNQTHQTMPYHKPVPEYLRLVD